MFENHTFWGSVEYDAAEHPQVTESFGGSRHWDTLEEFEAERAGRAVLVFIAATQDAVEKYGCKAASSAGRK